MKVGRRITHFSRRGKKGRISRERARFRFPYCKIWISMLHWGLFEVHSREIHPQAHAESCWSGLDLWPSHPHRLNDLEDGRADDYKDKEGNKLRADRVLVGVLAGALNLTPFGDIFGVLFVRLPHLGSRRHL